MNPTVSTRTKFPSQCEQLIKLFVHCMTQIGSFCKLHAVIVESQHPTLHFHRVLDQFAASTVWRYLSIWQHFSDALRDMDLHLDRLTEVELADVFVSLSLSHRSDPPTGAGSISAIKAVRWMTKVSDIQCLQDIVYGSMVSSYLRSKIPRERKEAVPLALYIVLQWERRILQTGCSVRDVILLGVFLVGLYASLRFSDLQRVKWSSIVFDYRTIRGSCWRTKTSATGQPFGLLGCGMLSDGFDAIWSELFPSQDLSLLQKSGIRALWSKLREPPAASLDASGSKLDTATSADNSWSDIFPPKLSSSVISNLK